MSDGIPKFDNFPSNVVELGKCPLALDSISRYGGRIGALARGLTFTYNISDLTIQPRHISIFLSTYLPTYLPIYLFYPFPVRNDNSSRFGKFQLFYFQPSSTCSSSSSSSSPSSPSFSSSSPGGPCLLVGSRCITYLLEKVRQGRRRRRIRRL